MKKGSSRGGWARLAKQLVLALFFAAFVLSGATTWAAEPGLEAIAKGSVWKYFDAGYGVDADWAAAAYDDTFWLEGPAPLGYGETNVATTVDFGYDPEYKFITTYFRRSFVVTNAVNYNRLHVSLQRDDGAVVYLNGVELYRDNLPAGPISYVTFAVTNVFGTGETIYYPSNVPVHLLEGTNVLAIELHQSDPESPDLLFDLSLVASNQVSLIRGPYLQSGSCTSILVRWRTDVPSGSLVRYGANPGDLNVISENVALTTEHEVQLTGLEPNTRYFYSIANGEQDLAGGPDYFFLTAPAAAKPTRIWVTGDTRTGDAYQRAVWEAYQQFTGARYTDAWLMLGDNGGITGTDLQFQANVFQLYLPILQQTVLWPTIGNHDTYAAGMPYLSIFSLPTDGGAGGVPSGTERYYAFTHGNIHFVVLDSVTSDISTNGQMYAWLAEDLAANTNDWLIAYWHYPPYSKGSHDSDWEYGMIVMRENFLPLLEDHGVDLVLCGHSHSYERSFLLDGHYGLSGTLEPKMIKNGGNGRLDGDGPYTKPSTGPAPHEGAVYVVAGSSGLVSGGPLNHPAMYFSENAYGSLVLDINGQTLEAAFLRENGVIDDHFTLIKGFMFRITSVQVASGKVTLTWNTLPGRFYRVHRQESLGTSWVPVSGYLQGAGEPLSWSDTPPAGATAFYQIEETPD